MVARAGGVTRPAVGAYVVAMTSCRSHVMMGVRVVSKGWDNCGLFGCYRGSGCRPAFLWLHTVPLGTYSAVETDDVVRLGAWQCTARRASYRYL